MLVFLTWKHTAKVDNDKFGVTAACSGLDFLQLFLAARQQMDLIQGGGMDRTDWEGDLNRGLVVNLGAKVDRRDEKTGRASGSSMSS